MSETKTPVTYQADVRGDAPENLKDAEFGSLKVRSLEISHPESQHTATVVAMKQGTGFWLTDSKTKDTVGVHVGFDQGAAIVFHPGRGNPSSHPLALFLDRDGKPILQICDDKDKTHHIDLTKLVGLVS